LPPSGTKRAPAKKKPEPVEPTPKTITQTPSGIEIAYFVEPKRMYKVRGPNRSRTNDAEADTGEMLWREVPSVTTVLKVLDKPALSWWGMRVGWKAVGEMWKDGYLAYDAEGRLLITVDAVWQYADFRDGATSSSLRRSSGSPSTTRSREAGDRGTSVHGAFEAWAAVGQLPDPDEFPPEEHATSSRSGSSATTWATPGRQAASRLRSAASSTDSPAATTCGGTSRRTFASSPVASRRTASRRS
jgi:hypothetical protein